MKVSEKYSLLVEISCKACKLNCNVCQHCDIEVFLSCPDVPQDCAVLFNVRDKLIKKD